MTLEHILKAKCAGDIFSNDLKKIKVEYKELCKQWHPDMNGDSEDSNRVMAKINELYQKGLSLIEKNDWEKSNCKILTTTDGRTFEIHYRTFYNFELGYFYICDKSIIYLIDKHHTSWYNNYKIKVKNLKYPNAKMQEEFERLIPKIVLEFETPEFHVMKVEKPDNVFSMIDVQKFYKGVLPDRHVAWMVNRLYNLVCFLEYNNISHNALTIESLFVNPEKHAIYLYGGWWFSCQVNQKIVGLPKKVFGIMPNSSKVDGTATRQLDLETVRLVARQLLGDEFGSKIISNKTIPTEIREWVLDKAGTNALKEYNDWNQLLDKAYGERTFIKMEINKNNLYE